jgi:hypothetical protein
MMHIRLAFAAIFLLAVSAAVVVGQEMPKPDLRFVRVEDDTVNGRPIRRFTIEITNSSEFSDELFAASPDLPPCGKNGNSSRTWINIYGDGGKRIYGWCGISSNAELSLLKFNVFADTTQPTKFFVDFVDRRKGKIVESNRVFIEE